jgi:hypothetical protein
MLLAASSTRAGQVELSVEGRLGGESNVFRSDDVPEQDLDPVSDGIFDISPRVGLRDQNDDFNYAAHYQPTYRTFIETSGIDGVDHSANGSAGWSITAIDRVEATLSYYNGRQYLSGPTGTGTSQTFTVNDRERIAISDLDLSYRRLLSQRLSVGVQGSFDDFDAGNTVRSQTDSRAYTGRVNARYALSELTELGLSASGRLRENRAVDPTPSQPRVSSQTDVWDVLFSVSHQFSPTASVSVQAGPSFIRQQQVPGGSPFFDHEEDREVTVFAAASANKSWQKGDVGISYVRTEARSGSVSSASSITDIVELNGTRRFSDRWTGRLYGSWNRFDQIANQSGNDDRFKLTSYEARGTLEYVLSRRVTLIGHYAYYWQEIERSEVDASSTIDVHLGYLGVRYTFESLVY